MFDAAVSVSGGTDVDVDGVGECESDALLLLLLEDDDCFFVGDSLDCCMNASIVCIRFFCCGLLSRYVRISFELWPGGGRGSGTDDGADAEDVVLFIDVEDSVVSVAVVPLIFVDETWILFIAIIT